MASSIPRSAVKNSVSGCSGTLRVGMETVPDTGYRIVGVADYTDDGKVDLLWHHATRGEVWVWPMDGTTRVTETLVGAVPDIGFQIVRTGEPDVRYQIVKAK